MRREGGRLIAGVRRPTRLHQVAQREGRCRSRSSGNANRFSRLGFRDEAHQVRPSSRLTLRVALALNRFSMQVDTVTLRRSS